MRAPPPENANGARAGAAAKVETTIRPLPTTANAKRPQALTIIGSIPKAHASQLRVSISTWRGEKRLEIRECTRIVGETFFPAGAGVTLPLEKLPEFIALLSKGVQR